MLIAIESFQCGQHSLSCFMCFKSLYPPTSQQADTIILQMRKWRYRNAIQPPQGHTGGQWTDLNLAAS